MCLRISLIILSLFFLGCSKEKSIAEVFLNQPAIIKEYPIDNPDAWRIICKRAPYINNIEIPKDVLEALPKVFNTNHGFPKAKDINDVCENEYTEFLK